MLLVALIFGPLTLDLMMKVSPGASDDVDEDETGVEMSNLLFVLKAFQSVNCCLKKKKDMAAAGSSSSFSHFAAAEILDLPDSD